MKTAIVYRANKHLDANLLPLKEKVDFFIRLEPADLPKYEIELNPFVTSVLRREIVDISKEDVRVFTDLTCARGAYELTPNVDILSQEGGPLEAYIRQVIDEGRLVIVVRENLADHVQIDGVDPYSLGDEARKPGGWYHAKVLAIWENMLRARGASYKIVYVQDLLRYTEDILGVVPRAAIVVCDHHCVNRHYKISAMEGWRNAYMSLPPGKFVRPEDILSHCL